MDTKKTRPHKLSQASEPPSPADLVPLNKGKLKRESSRQGDLVTHVKRPKSLEPAQPPGASHAAHLKAPQPARTPPPGDGVTYLHAMGKDPGSQIVFVSLAKQALNKNVPYVFAQDMAASAKAQTTIFCDGHTVASRMLTQYAAALGDGAAADTWASDIENYTFFACLNMAQMPTSLGSFKQLAERHVDLTCIRSLLLVSNLGADEAIEARALYALMSRAGFILPQDPAFADRLLAGIPKAQLIAAQAEIFVTAAAQEGDAFFDLMLEAGFDVHTMAPDTGFFPITLAIENGAQGHVERLLAKGADPRVQAAYLQDAVRTPANDALLTWVLSLPQTT